MRQQNYRALYNVMVQTATYPELDGASDQEIADYMNAVVSKRDVPPDGPITKEESLQTERGLHFILGAVKAAAVMATIKALADHGVDALMASMYRMLTQINDGAGIDINHADARAQIAALQADGVLDQADVDKLDAATHVRGPRWDVWFNLPGEVRIGHVAEARRLYA